MLKRIVIDYYFMILFTFQGISCLDQQEHDDLSCGPEEFKCLQLNLNQILTMHDWNLHPKKCIPQSYRCDGRHDCQDGSDEVECFVQLPRPKTFRCFVGNDIEMTVEDCLLRPHILTQFDYAHPHEISRSVSEMKEWVCAKMERPNGTLVRDCMSMYTGGEPFDVCFANANEGKKCLCSSELCNSSNQIVIFSADAPPFVAKILLSMMLITEFIIRNHLTLFL